MAVLTERASAGQTVFPLPIHTGLATVTVNGSAATIASQNAESVTLATPCAYGDTVAISFAVTPAGISNTEDIPPDTGKRLALMGDSITQGISVVPLTGNFGGLTESLVGSNGGLSGALCTTVVLFHGAQRNCTAGNGTLTYTKATNSITWRANGDSGPGAPVVLDRTKLVRLESATAGRGIYVTLRPNGAGSLPSTDLTDTTINVGATGNGYMPNVCYGIETYADWLPGLLAPEYTVIGKWANSGNHIQNIIDQIPEVIALAPDEVLVLIGTNDIAAGRSYATITGLLQTVYETFMAAGIRVTTPGILPRGDASYQLRIRGLNRWIERYAEGKPLMRYIEVYPAMVSTLTYPTASPFDVDTTLFNTVGGNYIHPSRKGSFVLASAIAANMKDGKTRTRWESPFHLYDATNNPSGNLLTNPQMLVGSARTGTVAGANIVSGTGSLSGTPPDDWSLWNPAGSASAATSSIVTRASVDATDKTPGNYWRVAISASGFLRAFHSLALANFAPGDVISGLADFYVDNPSLMTRFDVCLEFNGADRVSFGLVSGDSLSSSTSPMRFTAALPRFTVPASWAWTGLGGNPSLVRFFVNMNAAAGCNVYIGNVRVSKVS